MPLLTILAVILVAGGVGFGVWYWQNGELNKQRSNNDTRIAALQKQIGTKPSTSAPKEQTNPSNDIWLKKVKELKVRNIALANNNQIDVLQDPSNSNIFYYTEWGATVDQGKQGPNAIYRFDVSKAKNFAEDDYASFSLAQGDLIYQRDAVGLKQKNSLLKLVGFDGRKLVFFEMNAGRFHIGCPI